MFGFSFSMLVSFFGSFATVVSIIGVDFVFVLVFPSILLNIVALLLRCFNCLEMFGLWRFSLVRLNTGSCLFVFFLYGGCLVLISLIFLVLFLIFIRLNGSTSVSGASNVSVAREVQKHSVFCRRYRP